MTASQLSVSHCTLQTRCASGGDDTSQRGGLDTLLLAVTARASSPVPFEGVNHLFHPAIDKLWNLPLSNGRVSKAPQIQGTVLNSVKCLFENSAKETLSSSGIFLTFCYCLIDVTMKIQCLPERDGHIPVVNIESHVKKLFSLNVALGFSKSLSCFLMEFIIKKLST